jgi:hypothetical protein
MGKKDKEKEKGGASGGGGGGGAKLSAAESKQAKKDAKKAKQEAKAGKSATKQARKSGALDSDEEDIEVIMKELAAADAKKTAVAVEVVDQPSARVNFSLSPLPSGELILFGGEFFDGATNVCFNELYRFEPGAPSSPATTTKGGASNAAAAVSSSSALPSSSSSGGGTWRMIVSPTTPAHRCSHQAVVHNNTQLILFGGEFATANQFYHHGDTWRLDLTTNRWARCEASKKNPPPRSGHRMAAWRNYVVLFGGFYQTLTHDKWYGDLWLFDTRGAGSWSECVFPSTTSVPAPRSGTQLVLLPAKDTALIFGGYSEVRQGGAADSSALPGGGKGGKGASGGGAGAASLLYRKTRSVTHTDLWLLKLGPVLTGGVPAWERVRTTGIPPSPRVGFGMVAWKDRVLLFGGVQDKEGLEEEAEGAKGAGGKGGGKGAGKGAASAAAKDVVRSTFFNDLYSFDLGRRRWYPLELRRKKAEGERRRKPKAAGGKGGAAGGKKGSGAADGADDGADDDDLDDLDEDGGDDEEEALAAAAAVSSAKGKGAKKGAGGGGGGGGGGGQQDNGADLDDGAFYYYEDGKLIRIEDEDEDEDEGKEGEGEKEAEADKPTAPPPAAAPAAVSSSPEAASTAASAARPTGAAPAAAPAPAPVVAAAEPEPALPAPSGRIRSGMWVDGNWLYVYGGLREEVRGGGGGGGKTAAAVAALVNEREVTLDDMWRLDLRERPGWECLLAGRMDKQAWRGEEESEDEEEEEEDEEDDDDDDEDDEDGSSDGDGSGDDEDGAKGMAGLGLGDGSGSNAGAGAAGAASRFARSQVRMTKEAARARELRDQLGLEDASYTPQPDEELRDFFARTSSTWTARYIASGAIGPGVKIVGKEIRRRSFAIAKARYEEVWPLLIELRELEEAQLAMEAEAAAAAAERAAKARGKGGKGGKRG